MLELKRAAAQQENDVGLTFKPAINTVPGVNSRLKVPSLEPLRAVTHEPTNTSQHTRAVAERAVTHGTPAVTHATSA